MKSARKKAVEVYEKKLEVKDSDEKIITKNIPFKNFDLFFLGDTHIGSKMFQMKEFIETLKHIENTPNAYAVLTGDLIQAINKYSLGTTSETEGMDNEVLIAIDLLEKIANKKDANGNSKILAVVRGNHEYRNEKDGGVNAYLPINIALGLTDVYIKDTGILEINNSEGDNFNILLTHGSGIGGDKGTSILNNMLSLVKEYGRDIHMMVIGHKHKFEYIEKYISETIERGEEASSRLVRAIIAPAWLNYGEYGKMYNYNPPSVLKFFSRIKWGDDGIPIVEQHEYENRVLQHLTWEEYNVTMEHKRKATKRYDLKVRNITDKKNIVKDVLNNWEFLEGKSKEIKNLDDSWNKIVDEWEEYEKSIQKETKSRKR